MSARTISAELVAACKRLPLGGLLPTLADRLTLADKQSTPIEDVLLMLLTDEISRRDSTATVRRAQEAGLDPDMVLERWDKTAKVTYDRRVLSARVAAFRRGASQRRRARARGRGQDFPGERARAPVLPGRVQRPTAARRSSMPVTCPCAVVASPGPPGAFRKGS